MNEMLQLSQRPDYLHVLLSHFPVVGLGLALVVLCVGLIMEDRALTLMGLVMQCVLSATTVFVIKSGESALEHLKGNVDAETTALVEVHARMGETWGALYYITAIASLAAVVVAWKWPKRLWLPSVVAAGFTMISLIVGINIAHSGGKVRHPEFRTAPAPASRESLPP